MLHIRLNITALIMAAMTGLCVSAASPADYRGSRATYPENPAILTYPDSLTPVMINHVGRHGARYATSPKKIRNVTDYLAKADSAGTITPEGKQLLRLARHVLTVSRGRWGQLDSIGIAEQEGIAQRMYESYRPVFSHAAVNAISSYVPRCVMSMYAFCHRLTRLDSRIAITAASGPQTNPLMRPFETSPEFAAYTQAKPYANALNRLRHDIIPHDVASRLMGKSYPLTPEQADALTDDIYYMVSSCSAIGINVNPMEFFSENDYRMMWEASNVQQYFARNANTYSSVPSDIASALVMELITSTQNFIDGTDLTPVHLRFGHAETMMPLVSLLQLPGCYAPKGCPPAEISDYWRNYDIIPMASNMQMILFKAGSGRYYVRMELNEQPVEMIKGRIYAPWNQVRAYMLDCIPAQ